MNKYQELVEDVKKTNQLYNALKTKLNDEFVKKLASFLGCSLDAIIVEFESPQYFDRNDMITWKFNLVIKIVAPDLTVPIRLSGLSLVTTKDKALEFPLTIIYEGAEPGAKMEAISNAIILKMKRSIDKASWL